VLIATLGLALVGLASCGGGGRPTKPPINPPLPAITTVTVVNGLDSASMARYSVEGAMVTINDGEPA
jgi:hypothetical protein